MSRTPVSKVLVVDGDRVTRDALVTCLNFVGVEAHGAESAAAARFWLTRGFADVMVLSDELADGHPIDLVSQPVPGGSDKASIIVLTRHARLPPSLANYGVDDLMRRPVALSCVVERVESLLRERTLKRGPLLRFSGLALDIARMRVICGDREAAIGQTETRLLAFFIGNPDKVFSRRQLLQRVWPANVRVEERTVDVHIRRLRQGLDLVGYAAFIQTVRGSGYRFSAFA